MEKVDLSMSIFSWTGWRKTAFRSSRFLAREAQVRRQKSVTVEVQRSFHLPIFFHESILTKTSKALLRSQGPREVSCPQRTLYEGLFSMLPFVGLSATHWQRQDNFAFGHPKASFSTLLDCKAWLLA